MASAATAHGKARGMPLTGDVTGNNKQQDTAKGIEGIDRESHTSR
jgi:hypothetical protein